MINTEKNRILKLTNTWLEEANLSLSILEGVRPSKIQRLLKKVLKVHDIVSFKKRELKDLAKAISLKETFSKQIINIIANYFDIVETKIISIIKKQIVILIKPILKAFFAKKQILLL